MSGVELVVGISALAFVVSGALVGVRLMWLSRRTGGQPERTIGFSLFMLSGLSWPLLLVVSAPGETAAPILRAALAGAGLSMALGWSGVFLFTLRVFRPGIVWARAFAGVGVGIELGAGLAAVVRAFTLADASALRSPATPALLLLCTAQVAYFWSAFEAFHYRALLRRRIPLGLADPLVVDRVGLWGWSSVFAAGASAPATWAVVSGSDPHTTASHLVIAVCGLVCSATLLLAFLPPAWYVRLVRENAAAPLAEGSS
jgi:hypothetical protein